MRIALMVTCINDGMLPAAGEATVRLLRRLGVEADFPAAQTCSGQPFVNTGTSTRPYLWCATSSRRSRGTTTW